jgi:RNA polymerase sigma-70 factor (ECF subfamily)
MDSQLLELCRQGDALAVERLVYTYQQQVYRLALSILDTPHEAEDATQEAFLAALRALDSFQEQAAFKTWLYSITVNVCRTRLQRRKMRERLQSILQAVLPLRSPADSPEETTIQREAASGLWQAVCGLDEKHRLPLILRYFHDLAVNEIAAILDIPPGTVHSRLNTARAQLRRTLKEGQP